ncbi:MAG: hypothetical protein NT040_03450 [Bacteroidetes bacterium]|nr:hypothetical protein [Bacteroidota bacterium]
MSSKFLLSIFVTLFVIWISIGDNLNAQEAKDYDNVSIASGDVYVLNSVNNTNFANGRNRNAMVYSLPPNAKYAILRVLIDNYDFLVDRKNYQSLMSKFTSVSSNQYLLLSGSFLIEAVSPKGSGKMCDFYMPVSQEEKKKFLEEGHPWQFKTSEVNYVDNYTRLNTQSFAISIKVDELGSKDHIILAFQNHSLTSPCKVIVDIIAFTVKQ